MLTHVVKQFPELQTFKVWIISPDIVRICSTSMILIQHFPAGFWGIIFSSRNLGTLMYYLRTWVYYINIAMLTTCQVTWCTIIFWITTCKIGCTRKTIFLEYLLTVWCHLLKKNWACAQQYSASYTLIPILITQKL